MSNVECAIPIHRRSRGDVCAPASLDPVRSVEEALGEGPHPAINFDADALIAAGADPNASSAQATDSSEISTPWKASRLRSAVEPQWFPGTCR